MSAGRRSSRRGPPTSRSSPAPRSTSERPESRRRPGAALSNPNVRGWSDRSYDFFSVGVVASQLIYDFGQTTGRWRAALGHQRRGQRRAAVDRAHTLGEVRRASFSSAPCRSCDGGERDARRPSSATWRRSRASSRRRGCAPASICGAGADRFENARVQLVRSEGEVRTAQAVLAQALGAGGTSSSCRPTPTSRGARRRTRRRRRCSPRRCAPTPSWRIGRARVAEETSCRRPAAPTARAC